MNKVNLIFIIFVIFILIIISKNYDEIKIWILNRIIVLRGILSPNCFWYKISDLFIDDASGINLYNDFKKTNKDFVLSNMFGEEIYIVLNNKYIKILLDNSPDLFSVGKLKQTFFKSFMDKNVGVSTGCPWKNRRHINETALDTNMLHKYSKQYNDYIFKQIIIWKNKSEYDFNDFFDFGKKLVAKIVFNTDHINDDIYKIFSEANTIEVFSNHNFKIDQKIYDKYINTLNYYIDNPNPISLVDLCLTVSNNKEDIIHQIPHFMFPLVAISISVIPRLLVLIFNHKNILEKVIEEVNSIKDDSELIYLKIYKLTYIRQCILESLRINNLVITTFRTLTEDYNFDEKNSFKKGTQFLILNNPVLREKEYFEQPDKFIPSRWTPKMEKSYYAISFNQGPQRCPGKELAIYLTQSFIYNFFKIKNINMNTIIEINEVDINNIPQITNPFSFYIKIKI